MMQIKTIMIYSETGETNSWTFEPGKVNIITGARRTGKTALLKIVEYCMGRGECDIPEGVIRSSVAWYAVLFVVPGAQVFVARRNPPKGAGTSSDIHLEIGAEVTAPPLSELRKSVDIDGLVNTLSDLCGIRENLNMPLPGQTREPLAASLKHTWFYLFQRQDEVAAPSFLFHRETENTFMSQSIKDTLPYFLGVVRDNRFAKQEEARRVRREIRRIERNLSELEWIKGEALSRGRRLVAQAQDLGIATVGDIPEEQGRLVQVLTQIRSWHPERLSDAPGLALDTLQDERVELLRAYRNIKDEVDSALEFSSTQDQFIAENEDQRIRLQTIELLKRKEESFHCPLCNTELFEDLPSEGDLLGSLQQLSLQLDAASRERVRLDKVVAERQESLSKLRQEIREKNEQINAVLQQNAVSSERRQLENQRLTMVGRVSLYLESIQDQEDDSQLRELLEAYKEQLAALEEDLSEDDFQMRLDFAVTGVSKLMSSWTSGLDSEYSEIPHRFDFDHLTVVADKFDGPITMRKMGGGTNALSCHLLVLCALHHWFAVRERPVPNFLMLDQISQVYYPAELESDPSEDDRIAVQNMYSWLFERVRELEGSFQLIVVDHADLKVQWFQEAVVEKWRHGKKLVPAHWIKAVDIT